MATFHDEGVKIEKCHGNDKDAPFHALSYGVIRFELPHHRKKLLEKNSPKIEIFAKCCTLMAIFRDERVKMEKCHGNDKDAPFHALS